LRFNYEARNSATRSQRVQQPKSSTMAEKLKAQLWFTLTPKKRKLYKRKEGGEKKKKQTTLQQTSYNSYYNFNMSHAFSSSTSSFLLPSSQTKPMKEKMMITSSQTHN